MREENRYIMKDNQLHLWSEYFQEYVPTNDITTLVDSYNEVKDKNNKLSKHIFELKQDMNRLSASNKELRIKCKGFESQLKIYEEVLDSRKTFYKR